jgi:signal transduction histidine kinase
MDTDATPAGAADGGGMPSAAAPAVAGRMRPAFRYGLKNWRVRSRLLLLVVLPTLAAVILGGVGVVSSARSALAYQRVEQFSRLGGQITNLIQALQAEREDTIRYITIGSGRHGRGAPSPAAAPEVAVLTRDHRVTDRLAARVRSGAGTIGPSYPLVAQQEAKGAITAIAGLPALRSAAISTHIPALIVIQEYASTISRLLALEGEIATGSKDAALADTVRVVGLISASKEQTSQEQAILTSALTPDLVGATKFQPSQLTAISAAQAEQQADLTQFGLVATSSQRHLYDSALSSAQATHAQAQVQQAITLALDGGSFAENPAFTNAASGSAYLVASLHRVEQGFVGSIIGRGAALRTRSITAALIEGLAVMLVLALALLFTTAVGRSMARPLRRLRTGALQVAGVRLPETVRLMSEDGGLAEPLDFEPIDIDSTDEIGEVARAFDQVHREAVRLAANEAALRGNINAMFVNLSRRSQSLVERQIHLIDDLEQGEQDAERLANLFQMDHLATRMRRNSENLLVLAGHDLSRRWTEPVALVDVLRAAVSEIEHYERVTPHIQPGLSVRGPAVSDVVHLLSELVENATVFSPDESLVRVSGYALNSGGALLDITDQGVGMDPEDMAHVNWRLDNPPVVDVAASRRMGLFVVARLAARHGIRVRLRPAPVGGLTALVWLPDEVITRETIASTLSLRRFQPATSGAAVSWMEIGLAVTDPDPRAAAAPTVSAARTPHPEPSTPDTGDVTAEITDRPEDSALPAAPSASEPVAASVDAGPAAGNGGAAAPDNWVIVPPAGSADAENRLPIFESVESDWFRRGRLSADRSAPAPEASPAGWSSPADAGWRAAKVTQAPVSAGYTGAGLPKRVPSANLVPGGVAPFAVQQAPGPARSATQTRQRLASFQQGIRKARAAGTEDEPHASKEDL